MLKKYSTIIINLFLTAALAIFFHLIINHSASLAVIWIILTVYIWIFYMIYLNQFKLNKLLLLCSYIIMIIGITHFFLYGIEEVPFPEGAVLFHTEHIALSFFLCFIGSLSLIFKQEGFNINPKGNTTTTEIVTDKNKWEEATIEDLESGNFEPI